VVGGAALWIEPAQFWMMAICTPYSLRSQLQNACTPGLGDDSLHALVPIMEKPIMAFARLPFAAPRILDHPGTARH
jgi:hypothetical protein